MRERYEIRAVVVGDADRNLSCFEERQIDLIHVWREVNTACNEVKGNTAEVKEFSRQA